MKTWKDLKPGDKIYYWDKGKLHEQIVHVAELKVETSTWKDWYGRITEQKRDVMHIEAGKNSRTKVDLSWSMNDSTSKFYGMNRFACLEAAQNWIEQQKNKYDRKLYNLNKQIVKYTKIRKHYDIS